MTDKIQQIRRTVSLNPPEIDDEPEGFKSPESSNIHSARYFPKYKFLIVCFKYDTGGIKSVYTYEYFPIKEWAKFIVADSKGGHFNRFIRPIYEGKQAA